MTFATAPLFELDKRFPPVTDAAAQRIDETVELAYSHLMLVDDLDVAERDVELLCAQLRLRMAHIRRDTAHLDVDRCAACGSSDVFYDYDSGAGWSCRRCHRTDADE